MEIKKKSRMHSVLLKNMAKAYMHHFRQLKSDEFRQRTIHKPTEYGQAKECYRRDGMDLQEGQAIIGGKRRFGIISVGKEKKNAVVKTVEKVNEKFYQYMFEKRKYNRDKKY